VMLIFFCILWLVLRLVTTWEHRVTPFFAFFSFGVAMFSRKKKRVMTLDFFLLFDQMIFMTFISFSLQK